MSQPSLNEAINKAKSFRRRLESSEAGDPIAEALPKNRLGVNQANTNEHIGRTMWVRHTIGLRDETSLALRDAAEIQKRKARYGTLQPGEPRNEQEIADLGIQLAIKWLAEGNGG